MKYILFIMLMLLSTSVYASTSQNKEINFTIDVKYDGSGSSIGRNATLKISGDSMSSNETQRTFTADSTWPLTITKTFSWDTVCSNEADAWKNLTYSLKNIVGNQTKASLMMAKVSGNATECTKQFVQCGTERENQKVKLEACNEIKTKAEQYDSCSSSLTSCTEIKSTCSQDLKDAQNSGKSLPWIVGAVVAVVMYFVMKPKDNKPQEYEEFGDPGENVPPY